MIIIPNDFISYSEDYETKFKIQLKDKDKKLINKILALEISIYLMRRANLYGETLDIIRGIRKKCIKKLSFTFKDANNHIDF